MVGYYPSLDHVRTLVGRGKTVPIFRRLLADELTPVSAFAKLSKGSENAFLLESVVGGEHIARYSFVGADPSIVFRVRRDRATISRRGASTESISGLTDPLALLQTVLADFQSVPREMVHTGLPQLPRFVGGAVGYAAYDMVRYFEKLPDEPTDDRGLDDLAFGIYDAMVVFDHVNKTVLIVAHAKLDCSDVNAAYADACGRIDAIIARLNQSAALTVRDFGFDAVIPPAFSSTHDEGNFCDAVRKAIEYIIAGDIFQVVLSQRLRVHSDADPFDIYRALRVVNPSPFMFYVKGPGCILVGASPEILCRVEDGVVTSRPLAGTRCRGATLEEDAALEKELLADPKDRAEHIMLVDLGRNDVGRVAEAGSVELTDVMTIERYSHVMHISSNVCGKLAAGRTAMDALRAALPVGTVSGAPKIRAMQIIDELEPVRRGPYGGAVGYFDFAGNMDTCIALRTMVVTPDPSRVGWTIDIQAGAGIVADSVPALEYQETLNKAKALLTAVARAEQGSNS